MSRSDEIHFDMEQDYVYLVFKVYKSKDAQMCAACDTNESAEQFCKRNDLYDWSKNMIRSSRATVSGDGERCVVIEKVAVVRCADK